MTRRRLRVNGLDIVMSVDGSGPAVLLIHGLGCSGVYFQALTKRLIGHFTVYTPDLPGHGHSAKPATTMWRLCELTDWIAALVGELGLVTPLVVGHSLGGGIAVDFAARYPRLLRGAILLAPTGVPEMPSLLSQLPLLMHDGLREPLRLFPQILPAYMHAGPRRILRIAIDQTRYGQRQRLHQITRPMLVLRGSKDPLVLDETVNDLRMECQHVSALELADAAHALHVSHPRQVAAAIITFDAENGNIVRG